MNRRNYVLSAMACAFAVLGLADTTATRPGSLERPSPMSESTALEVTVLLADGDAPNPRSLREVSTDEPFYSGERFRLKVSSAKNGFLYVLMKDADGESHLLFPAPEDLQTGREHFMRRGQSAAFPNADFFRFDTNPGTERLWFVLSPRPIEELEQIASGDLGMNAAILRKYALGNDSNQTKGIVRPGADRDSSRIARADILPVSLIHLPD